MLRQGLAIGNAMLYGLVGLAGIVKESLSCCFILSWSVIDFSWIFFLLVFVFFLHVWCMIFCNFERCLLSSPPLGFASSRTCVVPSYYTSYTCSMKHITSSKLFYYSYILFTWFYSVTMPYLLCIVNSTTPSRSGRSIKSCAFSS